MRKRIDAAETDRLAKIAKESFEENARSHSISGYGSLEVMRERIDKLESAVAHLMGLVAVLNNLSDGEIDNEGGLFDF